MTSNASVMRIRLPGYSLGQELFNAVSHGLGAVCGIPALVLLLLKANSAAARACCAVFGAAVILLYTVSCLYHALSPRTRGKRVFRVLDHCMIYVLVLGTYTPVSLLGVGGTLGWALLGGVAALAAAGIALTAVSLEKYRAAAVVCHLLCGWSIMLGLPALRASMGSEGVLTVLLGGAAYTLGAVLYGLGARKKGMHCVFHVFCLAGTALHFLGVWQYLL